MLPKISIIVPVYNVEKYLHRCLDSLANQTLKDIEIILVDDESPDECPKICDKYVQLDSRFKVVHKRNEGLGMARNSGLVIANGEYVAFIDSDDFVALDTYETIYNIAKIRELDICFFKFCRYFVNGKTSPTPDWNHEEYFLSQTEIENFLLDMIGPTPKEKLNEKYSMSACKAIYKRSIFQKHNILFASERNIASEDLIFHLDYIPHVKRIGYIPKAFYYYFVNTNSITTTYSEGKYERLIKLAKEIKNRLKDSFPQQKYQPHYSSQLLRIFKVILRFESIQSTYIINRLRKINKICRNELLQDLYSDPSIKEYTYSNRFFIFCMKYQISFFFILIYWFKYKRKAI